MRNEKITKLNFGSKEHYVEKGIFIVVDLEVLEILRSPRHMCGAIRFPNIRSTWRNGKESIQGERLVYVMLSSSFRELCLQLCLFVFALILLPDKTDEP